MPQLSAIIDQILQFHIAIDYSWIPQSETLCCIQGVYIVRYNLTVGHCHMLVIFNCIPHITPYSSINGKLEELTVVLKKILDVCSVDDLLKWSGNKLIYMASHLRQLRCQYRQILLHSSQIWLIVHTMFNCGGLTWELFLSSIMQYWVQLALIAGCWQEVTKWFEAFERN
jgi:hypothetical protein